MKRAESAHTADMKRVRKTVSAVLCAAILLWYSLPSVQTLLNGPSTADAIVGAPLLTVSSAGTEAAAGSGDERLSSQMGAECTVRLFGVLPVRTVHTSGEEPTVAASGEAIGILMRTQGVQIVGLGGVRTGRGTVNPAADAGLAAGDTVLAVNGRAVRSSAEFSAFCNREEPLDLLCLRNGNRFHAAVTPVRDSDGVLRVGAWVRDSTSGIGTMSFFAPGSLRYAALGHGVSDIDTGVLLRNGGGEIYPASVTGVERASGGQAGELIGSFAAAEAEEIGSILENTPFGIAGTLCAANASAPLYPIAQPGEVRLGEAEMLSTVEGTSPQQYKVRVIRLGVQASPETDGMMIEVIDRGLLDRTGGIVQGMSGSPVLQNGKLIGVVTHVFLNDSARGYCIYAKQMYENLFLG